MKRTKFKYPSPSETPDLEESLNTEAGSQFGFWCLNIIWTLTLGTFALFVGTGCESTNANQSQSLAPSTPAIASTNALVQSCLLCHSTREMQRGPIIDGLPAWYIEDQLTKFMTGVRGRNSTNKSEFLMGSGVSLIKSDADVETVVTYFSELPPANHLKTVRGDATRGQQLYTLCATCHGPAGEGREDIKSPPLTMQEDWYLYDQLVRTKAGLRSRAQDDPQGLLMEQSIQGMNTQDFRDVVSYINDELSGRAKPEPAPTN